MLLVSSELRPGMLVKFHNARTAHYPTTKDCPAPNVINDEVGKL